MVLSEDGLELLVEKNPYHLCLTLKELIEKSIFSRHYVK